MTLKQATRQRLLEESPSKFQLGYSIFVTMFGAVVRKKKRKKKEGFYSVILDNMSTLVILVGKNDTVGKVYRYLVLQLQ